MWGELCNPYREKHKPFEKRSTVQVITYYHVMQQYCGSAIMNKQTNKQKNIGVFAGFQNVSKDIILFKALQILSCV